jgi:chloramphenicol-sensitive protein RarD
MKEYSGAIAAAAAFTIWGLLPIYWKLLDQVTAYEILCHRMTWSLLVTAILVVAMKKSKNFLTVINNRKYLLFFLLTALLLSVNWFIFIWAVNSGAIVEASLGYFINPLVSVCFGVLFLKEKMRLGQWLSLCIALVGVVYLTWSYGRFPWIAISLACTFACYGLLHKITPVPSLEGLCLETAILFVPALGLLLYAEVSGGGAFIHGGVSQTLLLAGTGIVTSVPLLFFCYAAQKVPLYLIGLLQYIAPTMNLVVGIFLYNEDFSRERMVGFVIIWIALAVFITEGLARQLRGHRTARKLYR